MVDPTNVACAQALQRLTPLTITPPMHAAFVGSTLIDVKIFIWIMSPLWSKRQVSYYRLREISYFIAKTSKIYYI